MCKVSFAAQQASNYELRTTDDISDVMVGGYRLAQRKSVRDAQSIPKSAAPCRSNTRQVGVGGAQKDDLPGSLIDEDQLPLCVQATRLRCGPVHDFAL